MIAPLWPSSPPDTRWLLRLPNWVGDGILVLPALRALPGEPRNRLAVAHPRVAALYRATGLLGEVVAEGGARAPWRSRAAARGFNPHRAVVFTQAPTGGLLALLSGAPLRLGRARGLSRKWFTHALPVATRRVPAWREHVELAVAAGGFAPAHPDFRIPWPASTEARVRDLLGEARQFVALAPGAAFGPAKRWPLESFAELARRLAADGRPVVVLGGPEDIPLGAALAKTGSRDLTGRTGLLEAIAILARAALLVANDSGALHLARAAGTPVVALFGSSSPAWTGPEADEGEVLRVEVPCSPCFRRVCPLRGAEHLKCLTGLTVDAVYGAVRRRWEAPR